VLPEPLPLPLRILVASDNFLSSLPHILPEGLDTLQIEGNDLPPPRPVYDDNPVAYQERLRSLEVMRAVHRCKWLKEELMAVCWSPARLDYLFEEYPSPQWNHSIQSYGPLNIITHDEIL
jgi:hypothetical protein